MQHAFIPGVGIKPMYIPGRSTFGTLCVVHIPVKISRGHRGVTQNPFFCGTAQLGVLSRGHRGVTQNPLFCGKAQLAIPEYYQHVDPHVLVLLGVYHMPLIVQSALYSTIHLARPWPNISKGQGDIYCTCKSTASAIEIKGLCRPTKRAMYAR
jgi:hypothetical protein